MGTLYLDMGWIIIGIFLFILGLGIWIYDKIIERYSHTKAVKKTSPQGYKQAIKTKKQGTF